MNKSYLIVLFMLIISDIFAQNTITGKVSDIQSKNVVGAVVVLADTLKGNVLYVTETDSLGEYRFISVPYSPYFLNITAIGYESQTTPVGFSAGQIQYFPIVLEKMLSYELEAVEVRVERPKMKRESGKFVMDQIAFSPFAQGSNTLTFLKFVPLINVNADGIISILNRSDATVYINGRKSNMDTEATASMLRGIPAKEIERIEIIPTPGATYSSSEKGGIVNIVIRKRPNEGVRVTLTLEDGQSYYNSQNASVFLSYSNERLSLTSGLSGLHGRNRYEMAEVYNFYNTNQNRDIHEINKGRVYKFGSYLNVDYCIDKQQTIGLRLNWGGTESRDDSRNRTIYKVIGIEDADSIYWASYRKRMPKLNYRLGANLNYDFKTDDKGSILKVDLTYQRRVSGYRTNSIQEKVQGNDVTLVDSYVMQPDNLLNAYSFKSIYRHFLNSDNVIDAGVSFIGGKMDNDYFFGTGYENGYVSDQNRSNYFLLKDYVGAAFVSYERTWSDQLETVIGLRFESYSARGVQHVTSEKVKRNDNSLLPSVSVTYTPSDNHELSLDIALGTTIPKYSLLNPFKEYISPTTFKENNPYLKPVKNFNAMFSYTMFEDYMLVADYMRDKDVWSEFSLPVESDLIKKTTLNYGTSHSLDISLIVSKHFFNQYLNFTSDINMCYMRDKGKVDAILINVDDISYGFSFKADIVLSKKNKVSFFTQYKWNSAEDWASGTVDQHQSLELSLVKRFKNSSLTLAGYGLLYRGPYVNMETPEYGYSSRFLNKRPTITVTYTYTFGNRKVKKIGNRNDTEMNQRLD